jgi:glycosyltransferase involved in cell wall biosynthesis
MYLISSKFSASIVQMSQKMQKTIEISVVVPVYNEELVIRHTLSLIDQVLLSLGVPYEIIVVNDGSSDLTLKKVIEVKENNANVRIIELPRNLGHMEAITAGYQASLGAYIVTIDADCQDPPEIIAEMYYSILESEDFSVIQAVRTDRSMDSLFKRNSAKLYYTLVKKLTGVTVLNNAADFRLVTREVLDFLLKLPEKNKIYRLLIPYFGFNIKTIPIIRAKRFAGKSKYNLVKMLSLSTDSVFNFSEKPLRLITRVGLFFTITFSILTIVILITWLLGDKSLVPGWTSIMIAILLSSSLILTSIGIVGEYIGKIYLQSLNRPSVIWREVYKKD